MAEYRVVSYSLMLPNDQVIKDMFSGEDICDRRIERINRICHCKIRLMDQVIQWCGAEFLIIKITYDPITGNHTGCMSMIDVLFKTIRHISKISYHLLPFKCTIRDNQGINQTIHFRDKNGKRRIRDVSVMTTAEDIVTLMNRQQSKRKPAKTVLRKDIPNHIDLDNTMLNQKFMYSESKTSSIVLDIARGSSPTLSDVSSRDEFQDDQQYAVDGRYSSRSILSQFSDEISCKIRKSKATDDGDNMIGMIHYSEKFYSYTIFNDDPSSTRIKSINSSYHYKACDFNTNAKSKNNMQSIHSKMIQQTSSKYSKLNNSSNEEVDLKSVRVFSPNFRLSDSRDSDISGAASVLRNLALCDISENNEDRFTQLYNKEVQLLSENLLEEVCKEGTYALIVGLSRFYQRCKEAIPELPDDVLIAEMLLILDEEAERNHHVPTEQKSTHVSDVKPSKQKRDRKKKSNRRKENLSNANNLNKHKKDISGDVSRRIQKSKSEDSNNQKPSTGEDTNQSFQKIVSFKPVEETDGTKGSPFKELKISTKISGLICNQQTMKVNLTGTDDQHRTIFSPNKDLNVVTNITGSGQTINEHQPDKKLIENTEGKHNQRKKDEPNNELSLSEERKNDNRYEKVVLDSMLEKVTDSVSNILYVRTLDKVGRNTLKENDTILEKNMKNAVEKLGEKTLDFLYEYFIDEESKRIIARTEKIISSLLNSSFPGIQKTASLSLNRFMRSESNLNNTINMLSSIITDQLEEIVFEFCYPTLIASIVDENIQNSEKIHTVVKSAITEVELQVHHWVFDKIIENMVDIALSDSMVNAALFTVESKEIKSLQHHVDIEICNLIDKYTTMSMLTELAVADVERRVIRDLYTTHIEDLINSSMKKIIKNLNSGDIISKLKGFAKNKIINKKYFKNDKETFLTKLGKREQTVSSMKRINSTELHQHLVSKVLSRRKISRIIQEAVCIVECNLVIFLYENTLKIITDRALKYIAKREKGQKQLEYHNSVPNSKEKIKNLIVNVLNVTQNKLISETYNQALNDALPAKTSSFMSTKPISKKFQINQYSSPDMFNAIDITDTSDLYTVSLSEILSGISSSSASEKETGNLTNETPELCIQDCYMQNLYHLSSTSRNSSSRAYNANVDSDISEFIIQHLTRLLVMGTVSDLLLSYQYSSPDELSNDVLLKLFSKELCDGITSINDPFP